MSEPRDLQELKADAEARQKSILWEDQFRNNRAVTSLLWHGDPNARPLQRAGLFVFGLLFLLYSTIAISSWFERDPEDRSFLSFVFALVMLLIAGRLFRNALRSRAHQGEESSDKDRKAPSSE